MDESVKMNEDRVYKTTRVPKDVLDKMRNRANIANENAVGRYISELDNLMQSRSSPIRISEIEEMMDNLSEETRKNYVNMNSDIISSIDEGDLIESKKGST